MTSFFTGKTRRRGENSWCGVKTIPVSEITSKLLKEAFTRSVSNATRKKWSEKHGVPKSAPTRPPKLDKDRGYQN